MAGHLNNPTRPHDKAYVKTPFGLSAQLPLQVFFDHILPPLRDDLDPRNVLEALRNGRKFENIITEQNRWKGFENDPEHSDLSVHQTFKPLDAIVTSIIESSSHISADIDLPLRLESNPMAVAKYRYVSDETFPDASFLTGSQLCWEKIAVCGEYEKDKVPGYAKDSIARVTDRMEHCMGRDLRRRFIFGFTIQNTCMRFWLCDRSRFLTSEPFNFITDHLPWIHFCLSVLYAKPDQLGWDTGMVPSRDGRNFDIPVRSADGQTRTYRTQSLLSSVGSHNRLGKGTIVWKAVRVEDGEEIGPPVALKDSWVYPDYIREGDAIRCIRLNALASQDEELVAQMVPEVEWHGDVFIGGDEPALDCTRTFGTDEPIQDRASKPSVYQLVHYRLVLTPVMEKSIEHEMSIPTIFHALAQVAGALRLMHKAGWVHRDVSTGNVLLGTPPRLVDFEYAKRASDEEDLALGTRFFKAFEVDTQSHAYMPPPELTPLPTMTLEELGRIGRAYFAKQFQEQEAARAKAESKGTRTEATEKTPETEVEGEPQPVETGPSPQPAEPQTPPPEILPPTIVPLRYNPLHDLESLWWIAVYFVLQRELHKSAPDPLVDERTSSWDREEQRSWANGVFHSNDFRGPIMYAPGSGYFHTNVRSIVHPAMRPVVSILEDLRQDLVRRYTELEKDPASIDFTCADGLHEQFIAKLSNIADLAHLKDVSLVPLAAPPRLIPPATVPAAPPMVPHQDAKSQIIEETKKRTKSKSQRKPTVITPAHRYNLRPRPKRS